MFHKPFASPAKATSRHPNWLHALRLNVASRLSKPPLQAGGHTHQRCPRPAVRVCKSAPGSESGIVAISRNRSSTGAEIVVGVRSVERRRHDAVPDQIFRKLVLPLGGHHVRLILGRAKDGVVCGHERSVIVLARVARRAERVRPTEMQAVSRIHLLADDQPRAPPRTLVLERQIAPEHRGACIRQSRQPWFCLQIDT